MRVAVSNPHHLAAIVSLTIVTGCSGMTAGASIVPSAPAVNVEQPTISTHPPRKGQPHNIRSSTALYVYASNRTATGSSELLVYDAGSQNPAPVRTIKKNLSDIGGIAVDAAGNLYVANGSAGNVLEYAPGATSLVQTYSKGLADPSDVAVANGTLYVADRGNAANGYAQQVLEYPVGTTTPSLGIAGIGNPPDDNEGIAVNPTARQGTFFASASTLQMVPFAGECSGSTSSVGDDLFPTLWLNIPLSNNAQAPGLAFDAAGNLYASDPCNNDVAIYSDASETWTYTGKVQGTFDAPLFLTIDGQYLAVPSSGNTQMPQQGYVTVIDLSGSTSTTTITNGLQHPIGAAVGPRS
jgi:hypothetical protein